MRAKLLYLRALLGAILIGALLSACSSSGLKGGDARALVPLSEGVVRQLAGMGSSPGQTMLVRIFKQENVLEVWKRTGDGTFKLFKSYEICAWSGELGPKQKEGDRQAPEGFYTITPGHMNPRSSYYLSFNTGYPNKFDRAHGRTGSNLMIHGACSSAGCYSMTDEQIAEIYALARESFKGGNQSIQLQIFPFRMTPENLAQHRDSPHFEFWRNLKLGYDSFEIGRQAVAWDVCGKQYVFNAQGPGGRPMDAAAACPALTMNELATRVAAYQGNEEAQLGQAIAYAEESEAREAARAEAELRQQEAARARGDAIGGFFSGIGNMIGLGGDEQVEKTFDPNLQAPVPMPRKERG